MSALAELIEIVRHCDVQYLDQWYGPKANPEDIATELHDAVRAEALRESAAVAGEFPARFPDMDAMKAAGLIGPHTMSSAIRDELCRLADETGEKVTAPAAKATPEYAEARYERYITALRAADPYALIERRDDLRRLAKAAMRAADQELDPVYRDGYGTGREHAGSAGWLLNHFEAVISTSDGSHGVAEEYRCQTCGAIGAQGDGPKTLLDLVAMAARHECLPSLPGGDA